MTSSVGSSGTSVGLTTFAEFQRLSTEGPLIDFAFFSTGEWDTEMFELMKMMSSVSRRIAKDRDNYLNDSVRGLSAHVVNGILVTKPVRALDLRSVSSCCNHRKGCVLYHTYATSNHLRSYSNMQRNSKLNKTSCS